MQHYSINQLINKRIRHRHNAVQQQRLFVCTDLSTITRFKNRILNADFSDYLVFFNYVLFCCTFFFYFMPVIFLLYIIGAAVNALCALIADQSHVSCPSRSNCLFLFYDKINDNDDDYNVS